MLKLSLPFFIYIITLYLIGERIRRNPKIDAFIATIEKNYSKINELLENTTVKEGLFFLRKIYGWLSLLSFTIILLLLKLRFLPDESILYTYPLFLIFFISWFSIKWVTEHKKTVFENLTMEVIIIIAPLAVGFLDIIAGTDIVKILAEPIFDILTKFQLPIQPDLSPIIIGAVVSCFIFIVFAFYYFLSWIVIAPFFLLSMILVITPIKFARFLAKLNPNDTFFWFALVLLTILTFFHLYL
ncbi:MAG: hypothetical protein ACTH5W_04380 [Providencia sp.]|uniref:hypothetical protein n=1 Tax=Providencia sp. TaxID=589 RepID=UPI003F9CEC3C